MSRTVTQVQTKITNLKINGDDAESGKTSLKAPIEPSGAFNDTDFLESTPVIGREYSKVQLKDLLKASDDVIRDFAYIVSSRGVVFLKSQTIDNAELQQFMKRFHTLAGAPKDSGLHIHPNAVNVTKESANLQLISSEAQKKAGGEFWRGDGKRFLASRGWHSDITFEPVPSDYSALKVIEGPATGGDTLWASGEELYNRLSPAFAKFMEGLEAVHEGTPFLLEAARNGTKNHPGPRGSPLNVDTHLSTTHPIVRTNPVTGKKSIFVNIEFTKHIIGLTPFESKNVLDHLHQLLVHNHDLQVRYKWAINDLAIWDNRSTYHSATFDFQDPRAGIRACSLGERPFFDPSYGS